jgi:putative ABC transport system permease protein
VQITITPGNNLTTVLLGGIVGLVIVVIGSLPFLYSVKKVTPKQLLQSGNHGVSRATLLTKILVYIPIPLVLIGILYVLTQDFEVSVYSVLTVISLFFLAVGIVALCVFVGFKARYRLGLIGRSGVSSIKWRGIEAIIGIASIITACTGIFVVSAVEDNTIANLQQNISQNAPSVYIIDITTSQLDEVKAISGSTFTAYPIVRGRLQTVGPVDVRNSNRVDLTREFNTTFQTEQNNIEEITGGVWHGTSTTKAVSVDREFALEVGDVRLGDKVQVLIQGILVEATITSFHTANRSNGTPFFFLIFSPDVLQNFPASYFATVEGSDSDITILEQKLGQRFPNIIPIRTQNILNSVEEIIGTLVYVLKLIGIPSILLGMILILVMTGQSMYERRSDALILRAFGLTRKQVVYLFMFEILLVILLATSIAYVSAHIIAYSLNMFIFSFNIFIFSIMPVYISLVLIAIVSIYGFILSKYITSRPLKELLAEK